MMARLSLFSLPRFLSGLTWRSRGRVVSSAPSRTPPPARRRELVQEKLAKDLAGGDDLDHLVADLLGHGRVALLLRPQLAVSVQERHIKAAQEVLDETMSLVPGGDVAMHSRWLETGHQETSAGRTRVQMESAFLD